MSLSCTLFSYPNAVGCDGFMVTLIREFFFLSRWADCRYTGGDIEEIEEINILWHGGTLASDSSA